ncbi:MAG: hypothetical protein Q9191_005061 [Dirinaria sp. TL-2023a]
MSGPYHPSDDHSTEDPPGPSLTRRFGDQTMVEKDETESDFTRSDTDNEMEDEDKNQEIPPLQSSNQNENHRDTIYTMRGSVDDAFSSPLRREPREDFGRSSFHQSNRSYERNFHDVLDIVRRHLNPENGSMASVSSPTASRPARRRRRSETRENVEGESRGGHSQAVQTPNLPDIHYPQQQPDSSIAGPSNHIDSNSNNSRPRSQGSAPASGLSARGVRMDSFSRTVVSEDLFADENPQLHDRKRRRIEQDDDGQDMNDAGSSSVRSRRVPRGRQQSHSTLQSYGNTSQPNIRGERRSELGNTRRTRRPLSPPGHVVPAQTNVSRDSPLNFEPSRIVYLAELIPRHIRWKVLPVLRRHAPYLPVAITAPVYQAHYPFSRQGITMSAIRARASLPVEVFEKIGALLSRDDLLRMRLVNHEFEKKISGYVFKSVVVPFKPDLYGMSIAGTGRIALRPSKVGNDTDGHTPDQAPDGMEIFKSWGHHIKKFAMSFDIDQETLTEPPHKGPYHKEKAFWGQYDWPHPDYSRFTSLALMESKADETRCMTIALSTLDSVTELGLSVDSGLGWMQGPDISDRAATFQTPVKIFGTKYALPSDKDIHSRRLWAMVRRDKNNDERETFQTVYNTSSDERAPSVLWAPAHPHPTYEPMIFKGEDLEDLSQAAAQERTNWHPRSKNPFMSDPLIPNRLREVQIQWLLENQWAQKAFLTSFSLALIDNAATFQHVRTLNIAKLSSRYIIDVKREDFWSALPQLEKLILFISPDWREVSKASGIVHDAAIVPSGAVGAFYDLLDACIKDRKNLVSLDLGWVGGGERATGMFARNRNVLPAPVLDINVGRNTAELGCKILNLPYVKSLSLTNCWFVPDSLKDFTKSMQNASLETLKLESVSLIAAPGASDAADNAGNAGQAALPGGQVLLPGGQVGSMGGQAAAFANALARINQHNLAAHANAGIAPILRQNVDPAHIQPQEILRGTAPPGGHLGDPNSNPPLEPTSSSLSNKQREGSWPKVIDEITPGLTIDHQRYLHNLEEECPKAHESGSLRRIDFVSCGYVRLRYMRSFNQEAIPHVMTDVPICLMHRQANLNNVMMSARLDPLLGQIVPIMAKHESDTLQFAFGMHLGWDETDMSKYYNREDAQPVGGSGRFSGVVKKSEDSQAVHQALSNCQITDGN